MNLFLVLLQGIALDAVNPLVFLPAFAVGWFARRVWQIVVGAFAIAAVQTALSLIEQLPAGAERVLWAEPLGVVAPLLLSLVAFSVRTRLSQREDVEPAGKRLRFLRTAFGATIGAISGGALFFGLGLAVITVADIHDREGGEYYLLALIVTPLGAFIGLVIGSLLFWRRSGGARNDVITSSGI